jgi:GT2 family glycosyltransferase
MARVSENPVVSVIILTWNHSYLLKDFLRSFYANVGADWLARTELIIVDNGSTDDTEILLREWQATTGGAGFKQALRHPVNLGFAAGNNAAIRRARGEYLLLLNNDVVLQSDLIQACLEAYNGTTRSLLGARLISRPTPWNQINGGFVRYLEGWCLFANASTFREVGLRREGGMEDVFDETFSPAFFEDVDLSLRAHIHGIPLREARLPVHHLEGRTTKRTESFPFMEIIRENQRRFQRKWSHLRPEDLDPVGVAPLKSGRG